MVFCGIRGDKGNAVQRKPMGGLVMAEITNCDVKGFNQQPLITVCDESGQGSADVVTICDHIRLA